MTGKDQARTKAKKNILGRWRKAGAIGLGLLPLSSEPALGLPREVPLVWSLCPLRGYNTVLYHCGYPILGELALPQHRGAEGGMLKWRVGGGGRWVASNGIPRLPRIHIRAPEPTSL